MNKYIYFIALMFFGGVAQATTYAQHKQQVRNALVKCLKDPENSKYSATYNGCLLEASENFIKKSDLEFKSAYQKANQNEKNNLINDREIYKLAFKNCEIFQNLSYSGFNTEANCKLETAKNYLSLLTRGSSSYPKSWTLENRVDNLYIGY